MAMRPMPSVLRALPIALSIVWASAAYECSAQGLQTGITRRENFQAVNVNLGSPGLGWSYEISVNGAKFLRLFFTKIRSQGDAVYEIHFVNRVGHSLGDVGREEFERASSYVTSELRSSTIEVQVVVTKG